MCFLLTAIMLVVVPYELTSLLFYVKSTKVTREIGRFCRRILACGRVVACTSPCSGVRQHNVCVPCSYSARQLLFHISIHTITVSIDGPYAAYMEKGWEGGGLPSPLAPTGYATHPTLTKLRSIPSSFLEAFKFLDSIVTSISLQDYVECIQQPTPTPPHSSRKSTCGQL